MRCPLAAQAALTASPYGPSAFTTATPSASMMSENSRIFASRYDSMEPW